MEINIDDKKYVLADKLILADNKKIGDYEYNKDININDIIKDKIKEFVDYEIIEFNDEGIRIKIKEKIVLGKVV